MPDESLKEADLESEKKRFAKQTESIRKGRPRQLTFVKEE